MQSQSLLHIEDSAKFFAEVEENERIAYAANARNVYLFVKTLCLHFLSSPNAVILLTDDAWRQPTRSEKYSLVLDLDTPGVHQRLEYWMQQKQIGPSRPPADDLDLICYQQASSWSCPPGLREHSTTFKHDHPSLDLFREYFSTEFQHVSFGELHKISAPFIPEIFHPWMSKVIIPNLLSAMDGDQAIGRNLFLNAFDVPHLLQTLQDSLGAAVRPLNFLSIPSEVEKSALLASSRFDTACTPSSRFAL
jgi:hypothetical protein